MNTFQHIFLWIYKKIKDKEQQDIFQEKKKKKSKLAGNISTLKINKQTPFTSDFVFEQCKNAKNLMEASYLSSNFNGFLF